MKKYWAFFLCILTFCMLTNSSLSLAYAALGLRLWYEKMVPVLFPFMVLSGTLIRMGLVESLIRPIRPFSVNCSGYPILRFIRSLWAFYVAFPWVHVRRLSFVTGRSFL